MVAVLSEVKREQTKRGGVIGKVTEAELGEARRPSEEVMLVTVE